MPTSYKDIIITPNRASATDSPNISFRSGNTASNTEITLRVYPESNGTLSFEGNAGQLFSITNDLTGSIFSVNDVSGIPSIEVFANGVVELARYNGNVRLGNLAMTYETSNNTVIYSGNVVYTSNIVDLPTQTITSSTSFSENSAGKIIVVNNGSSDVTLTFAAAATSGFATSVFRKGTGNVTIAAGAGVTKINSASFISSNIAIANASATIVYSATNEIILLGDIQTNGITGPQGVQGVQGTQGFGGGTGGSGAQGAQGLQGVQGPQGLQGLQGLQGVQGPQGLQGTQGLQGLGSQGPQGLQGLQGSQGLQGLQGLQGSQGLQGLQGRQGPQGLQGLNGTQGLQGLQGLTGSQGPQGLQGLQGLNGTQGPQGLQGLQGLGSQGPQGLQGLQGLTGIQGPQGLQGLQGLTGPTGNNITVTDTRAGTTTPETFANPRFAVDFKQLSSESLTDAGTYFGEISFRPYGSTTDWTGGPAHQLGFPQSGNVWHRWGSSTTWGSWTRMLDTTDFSRGMTLTGPLVVSANVTATSNIVDLPVLTVTTSTTVNDNAAGKLIVVNNTTSDVTITFATATTSGFATSVFRKGTGNVIIAAGAGVTKSNSSSFISGNIAATNATATIVYTSTSEILVVGDIQTNGISGPQGVQGVQGLQGPPGTASSQGSQGTQGTQGLGSQGLQGAQGSGSQGSTGSQGPQGLTGSQGPQGLQGLQGLGSQGPQGLQGLQGLTGSQGSQGLQGLQGLGSQGPQGLQGLQGLTGSQGSQGLQGLQGLNGSQGPQGLQGLQGLTGIQGPQGLQGLQGLGSQGPQGLQGLQGVQGPQGLQGLQGVQGSGSQGTQGLQGSQGLQGLQGLQGSQGLQGLQGLQGRQGPQGLNGSQGPQGLQGLQGLGSQGPQGLQGLQGVQGPQGLQGLQGLQGVQGALGPQGPTVVPRSATTTTLVIGDVGKCVDATAGITVPNAVFSAGDIVSIYANVAAGITITQGTSLSLRLAGSTTSGNRTLAGNGICTIWFSNSSCGIISGAGLT